MTHLNADEDLISFVKALRPERWKIFQVLSVQGQNDHRIAPLQVSAALFESFVARHRVVENSGVRLVAEDNEKMSGSYAMIDPAGRFFDNIKGFHSYSHPILDVGLEQAWQQVSFQMDRFLARDGLYDWSPDARARTAK